MFGEVWEQLLAFLTADRPFADVSRLAVVSKTWRSVSLNALKTVLHLNLSGFAESVVRLALVRVTSENLRGCQPERLPQHQDIRITLLRHVPVSRRLT